MKSTTQEDGNSALNDQPAQPQMAESEQGELPKPSEG